MAWKARQRPSKLGVGVADRSARTPWARSRVSVSAASVRARCRRWARRWSWLGRLRGPGDRLGGPVGRLARSRQSGRCGGVGEREAAGGEGDDGAGGDRRRGPRRGCRAGAGRRSRLPPPGDGVRRARWNAATSASSRRSSPGWAGAAAADSSAAEGAAVRRGVVEQALGVAAGQAGSSGCVISLRSAPPGTRGVTGPRVDLLRELPAARGATAARTAPGRLPRIRAAVGRVEAQHGAQHDRLGLVARERGDQRERGLRAAPGRACRPRRRRRRGGRPAPRPPGRPSGRRRARRRWSSARLRPIVVTQPRKPSASPLNRSRSRNACAHASLATSSASPRPTSTVR